MPEQSEIPRKRRRPAFSCEQCRQRKVRCDRGFPCRPCLKARHVLPCSYSPAERISGEMRPGERGDNPQKPDHEKSRLEHTVQDLQGRVRMLEQLVLGSRGSRSSRSEVGDEPLGDGMSSAEGHSTSSQSGKQDMQMPLQLRTTTAKTKFAGPSHWTHVFHQLLLSKARDNPLEASDRQGAEMREEFHRCKRLRTTIKARQAAAWVEPFPDLMNDLPDGDFTGLTNGYFDYLAPIYGILSCDRSLYTVPLDNMSHGTLLRTLLLVAIGAVFHPNSERRQRVSLYVRRWIYAAQWWLTGPSEKAAHNLEGLEVFCLMVLCRQVHSLDKESIWATAGALVRFACTLGLHRDPGHFPSLSPFERQRRRCLWQAVVELSIQSSIDVVMPPLISEDDYDTKPPENIDVCDIDQHSQTTPHPRPDHEHTSVWFQRFLTRTLSIRIQVARSLSMVHSLDSYERALELGSQLDDCCKELNSHFSPRGLSYILLDTQLHRTMILLYRPFVVQAIHNPLFYLARKLSLDAAMAIASYARDHMNIANEPLNTYTQLCMTGVGTFRGPLSLDVVLAICLEVITQLDEGHKSCDQPIRHLEHIQKQMFSMIEMGIPSMKRYAIISTALSQIRETQRTGDCSKDVVHKALLKCARKCVSALERHIEQTSPLCSDSGFDGDLELSPRLSGFDFDSLVCILSFALYISDTDPTSYRNLDSQVMILWT